MEILRDANRIFFGTVRRVGSGSRMIAGSSIVVLIISLCVLLVGIIS